MFQEIGHSITQKCWKCVLPSILEVIKNGKPPRRVFFFYCISSCAVSFMIDYERQNLGVKVLFTQTSYNSKELMHCLTPNVPRTPTSRRTAGTPGAPQPTVAAEFAFPSRVNPWDGSFTKESPVNQRCFTRQIIAETVDQREFYAKTLLEFQTDNGT